MTQFYRDLTRKNFFFAGCSWLKFNNLGLAQDMTLKFHTSVPKVLKLKVKKFWVLNPTFVEVIDCSNHLILDRVNIIFLTGTFLWRASKKNMLYIGILSNQVAFEAILKNLFENI